MRPIASCLNKVLIQIFGRNPLLGEIFANWDKIAGVKFGSISCPLKITTVTENRRKLNILIVGVDNSSAALEISFGQEAIMERIAVYLGYRAIHKLRTVVTLKSG